MSLPHFLILGGKKCGTTALYDFLRQHPQIYSPWKEMHFFDHEERRAGDAPADKGHTTRRVIDDFEAYQVAFRGAGPGMVTGEATPSYLHLLGVPERIKRYAPQAKLIALLRNPVDRAFSDFLHERLGGRERNSTFAAALIEDDKHPWVHYKPKGFYFRHLTRYLDLFDREQLRIYPYEDLVRDPLGLVRNVFRFLGVDHEFIPDVSMRARASGIPRSRLLHRLLSQPNLIRAVARAIIPRQLYARVGYKIYNRNMVKPVLSPTIRAQLQEVYREDILKLQDLIGRDLSHWLG